MTFKWVEDISKFDESCNEESGERYPVEVNIQYLEYLHNIQNDLPFLPERIKIEKVEKLVANLYDKTEHAIHIKNLNRTLNHGLR